MKQTRGASKRIDRLFAGVGRIALSSGTDHGPTVKRINAMLTGLYKIGRLDILAAIRDGVHKPLVVLHLYERGQLDKLPSAETAQALLPTFRAFVEQHECGIAQRRNMRTTAKHLGSVKGATTAQIADLPRLLRELKKALHEAGKLVTFNKARAHALTFAGELQGEMSPLWIEVMRVKRFKGAAGKRATQRRPLTVAELDLVCAKFADHEYRSGKSMRTIYGEDVAAMTRVLATTGMRPSEYWMRNGAVWRDMLVFLRIEGTKTAAATRPTFRIVDPHTPWCGEQFYRRVFADATQKALGIRLDTYSLRRTFAALTESAGIEESRRKAYLGHGPKTVTDLYTRTNVLPFVQSDGAKLASFLRAERERAAAPTLRLEKNG